MHLSEQVDDGCAIGLVFVRALLELFFIVMLRGILADVGFLTKSQRTDNGEGHFAHTKLNGHGREMALEGEVHQRGVDDVILMMTKRYLGATQILSEVEELFAALPGAEKTGGLFF